MYYRVERVLSAAASTDRSVQLHEAMYTDVAPSTAACIIHVRISSSPIVQSYSSTNTLVATNVAHTSTTATVVSQYLPFVLRFFLPLLSRALLHREHHYSLAVYSVQFQKLSRHPI
jgi:hypothetical protein